MKKTLIITLVSVMLSTSLVIPGKDVKAETVTNNKTNIIQPRESGSFIVTASSGAYIYAQRDEASYRVYYAPCNTVLWRMEYGTTYDQYGRAWYKVRTYDSYYSGWILASTGYKD
ncbi:hypothetical protein ACQPVP_02265 [Clostridium nigeriense]|uniref:hypothetical protein n=1 Tax=Clostridium nigeriense TaxID=1805470 RepID=UPI003D34CFDB